VWPIGHAGFFGTRNQPGEDLANGDGRVSCNSHRRSSAFPGLGRQQSTRPAAGSPGPLRGAEAAFRPDHPQAQQRDSAVALLVPAQESGVACLYTGFDPGQRSEVVLVTPQGSRLAA